MDDFKALLERYDYPLPKERIALTPAEPRDSAKLLVYNHTTGTTMYDSTFADLADFIPRDALLVFNDTKVLPARLYAKRKTGGIVEILCTKIDTNSNSCHALANKRLKRGEILSITGQRVSVSLTVLDTNGEYAIAFDKPIMDVIHAAGAMPIPPYLKHTPLSEDELRERYQTLFAKTEGSIAAPTASLHFTNELLKKIADKGIESAHVTLHVDLGTFAPLTEEKVREGKLHAERYSISKEAAAKINSAKKEGCPIIAVGTTATRTLESAASDDGYIEAQSGETRLFIREGYRFKVIDGLITNFHVPQSSLLMLVAALVGRTKLFELYDQAAAHGFRFLSFGDGMLII